MLLKIARTNVVLDQEAIEKLVRPGPGNRFMDISYFSTTQIENVWEVATKPKYKEFEIVFGLECCTRIDCYAKTSQSQHQKDDIETLDKRE